MLDKQQEEKKRKEKEMKDDMNQQAEMWQKERDMWDVEEKRLQEKIKKINLDTQQFLLEQDKLKKVKSTKMGKVEKEYNKGLMKEIRQKQKTLKQQQKEQTGHDDEELQ